MQADFACLESRSAEKRRPEMPPHSLDIAIVADDLTGALDTAAPFASLGFSTSVFLDQEQGHLSILSETQVLSLNSDSRHLPPGEAEEQVHIAVAAALRQRPRILFKKIDSTLRGNVAVEILASMHASRRRHALIAPAVPSQGRTTEGGEVFINGVPLRQTEIAADSLSSPSASLQEVLARASDTLTVHLWPRHTAFPPSNNAGIHAYVADCKTDADLDFLSDFVTDRCEEMLLVGASGFGAALARGLVPVRSAKIAELGGLAGKTGPILFVIGSRTALSAQQAAKLYEAGAQEIVLPLSATEQELRQLLERLRCDETATAIVVRPMPLGAEKHPSEVARLLASTAATLIQRLQVGAVAIVGGDTALATFRSLGVRTVTLMGQLESGVAVGIMLVGGRPTIFVTRSGGFGNVDSLVRVWKRLQNG
jgi:uncharacterized protein YgbK (DUF1537 family)